MANDKLDSVMEKLDNVEDKVSDIRTKLEVHLSKYDMHVQFAKEQNDILKQNTEILQENTQSLRDHMERTDLLETYVKQLEQRVSPVEMDLLRSNAVADWWKNRVIFMAKLGGAIAAASTILGLLKWLINAD